jgi:RNA recognition motif-containing protein
MSKELCVANFPNTTPLWDLYTLFSAFGEVEDITIHLSRRTGRKWAVIEMGQEDEAQKALDQLDGHRWCGRRLRVSEAPREKYPARRRREQ